MPINIKSGIFDPSPHRIVLDPPHLQHEDGSDPLSSYKNRIDKWATVSESLRSLRGNEGSWAIRSGRSEEMSDVSELLISLTKNERMSDSLKEFWLKNRNLVLLCFT